jgi:alpha-1,3/alpha-1,6-mannosyltransferase
MSEEKKRTRVLFIHPCLGIGGAEQFIVSAGLSFKNQLNYNVKFLTTEFDPNRCFPELLTGKVEFDSLSYLG